MAVIGTESPLKSIRRDRLIQGIVLVLVLFGAHVRAQCEQAKKDVQPFGFVSNAVLDRPSHGELCGDNSCCTNATEHLMWTYSKRRLESFLRDSITKLSSLFEVRAKKFDGLFRLIMNNSRIEFHEMFQKTYGKIYLQNSDVFSDFFKELELYYRQGASRLTDTLESFFSILYQRMFTVINSQYHFDDKYMQCVAEHMDDVKPFADVPQKFTVQLRRSFVATRTFHKALATAAETAKRVLAVKVDADCEKELVYMQFCGACKGQGGKGTCSDYCAEVLGKCLRQITDLRVMWDLFIDALDKVAERLVGPYNVEVVVEPLNIKISEAIMNFQESGTEVSRKIYSLCGKPSLSRRKRKVNNSRDGSGEMKTHKRKKPKKYEEEEDVIPTLERIIKEIKTKVRETRQFWAHLPYQFCNNITAPPSVNETCWKRAAVPKTSAAAPSSPIINEQIYRLQDFSDKLRKAYHGEEVEIVDDTEEEQDGSGSGSGDFEIDSEGSEERSDVVDQDTNFVETANEVPEEPQAPPSTKRPQITRTYSGGAGSMSLSRALVQYLLPIVLVWFGGAISDLL